jgi:hypothetical protein
MTLLKKGVEWKWDDEEQDAFDEVKNMLALIIIRRAKGLSINTRESVQEASDRPDHNTDLFDNPPKSGCPPSPVDFHPAKSSTSFCDFKRDRTALEFCQPPQLCILHGTLPTWIIFSCSLYFTICFLMLSGSAVIITE